MADINDLFGIARTSQPVPNASTMAPAPAALPANYNDFYKQLLAARMAQAKAHPSSLFNMLSGRGTDAAAAQAGVDAPDLWQKFQTGQMGVQNGQIAQTQGLAGNEAMTGVHVDLSNPGASEPALAKSYGAVMGSPMGANATGQPAGPSDAVTQQRAFLMRMSRLAQMQGNTQAANEYFKAASQGAPEGTMVTLDGLTRDGTNGAPVTMGAQDYAAQGEGKVSTARTAPVVAGQLKVAGNQAALDRTTSAIETADKARYDQVSGFDKTTGQPVTITKADLANNRAPNFVQGDNPYFAGQQSELKGLRDKSESADQGLGLAQQISNAANGIYTGKGSNSLQDARKFAQAAANLTGTKLDPSIDNNTSQFEQLKFASQQLVAVASHSLSPRVAMNIYNQIAAVKPGDTTSIKGLRDIINNQIVPALQRDKAIYGGVSEYYKKHPTSNDAMATVPNQHPLSKFGVRSVHDAQPGDYFADPVTGMLRQRPAH